MPVVLDSKQFAEFHKRLARRFMPAVMRGVRAGAARAIPYLVNRTRTSPPPNPGGIGSGGAVNTGAFVRSWRVLAASDGAVIVNTAPHGPNVEYGRKAGSKFPPRAPLIAWIKRRLLTTPKAKKSSKTKEPRVARTMRDENGRRKTGKPPVTADRQAERLYFPIARAIARRGLAPRKILTAPESHAEILRLVTLEVVTELKKETTSQ